MGKIVLFLNGFTGLATLGTMLYAGRPWKEGFSINWLVGFIVFGIWAISPYCYLFFKNMPKKDYSSHIIIDLIGTIAITLFGLFVYYTGFFGPYIDAQSGLLFLFVPFYQWIGIGVIFGVGTLLLNKYSKTK